MLISKQKKSKSLHSPHRIQPVSGLVWVILNQSLCFDTEFLSLLGKHMSLSTQSRSWGCAFYRDSLGHAFPPPAVLSRDVVVFSCLLIFLGQCTLGPFMKAIKKIICLQNLEERTKRQVLSLGDLLCHWFKPESSFAFWGWGVDLPYL